MKNFDPGKFIKQLPELLFLLLPLGALPLAWLRLSGKAVPYFGTVNFFSFTEAGLIALAVLVLNFSALKEHIRQNIAVRFTAVAGAALLLVTAIQQFYYGGTTEHFGNALFYAATPLAAAVTAHRLRKVLPLAAAVTAVSMLFSGIVSEKFTGLTGNWNWTQVMIFALLPGIFYLFRIKNRINCSIAVFAGLLAAGSFFYPAELSRAVVIALSGCWIFFALWRKMPGKFKFPAAAVLFISGVLLFLLIGVFCDFQDSRIQLYRGTVRMLAVHGISGVGVERFFDFIPEYLSKNYFLAPFSAPHHPHPHNEILFFWSSFGIAGLFFAGVLFCSVAVNIPTRIRQSAKLLPVWIFIFIFVCGQFDRSAAILPGAFWMLVSAGTVISRPGIGRKPSPAIWQRAVAGTLLTVAALSALLNFRAGSMSRLGLLELHRGNPDKAMEYFTSSLSVKADKNIFYRCAEIELHHRGNHVAALQHLESINELGFLNYLHSNRMQAVCLAALKRFNEALSAIKRDCRNYPCSVINARLHLNLLRYLHRPQAEQSNALNALAECCKLRRIPLQNAAEITMIDDDKPLFIHGSTSGDSAINYQKFFPGIMTEVIAAVTLFFAALGAGALCCLRRRQNVITELACGIIICAFAGAVIPALHAPVLLVMLAPAGVVCNLEKMHRHWKTVTCFVLLMILMLSSSLLPPGSQDEQVYQIPLLKHYAQYGFFNLRADNPYSAYPSLPHSFLLTAFLWGGLTLPRLMTLLLFCVTGMYISAKLVRSGKFSGGVMAAAILISPLTLIMAINFYVEPFILVFSIAGVIPLLKEKLSISDCLLAGAAAGAAAAVKLTGCGAALGIFILLLFRVRRKWEVAGFILTAAAVAALFYLRTWIFFENPFYPYGSALFNSSAAAQQVEKFHRLLGGHYGIDAVKGTLFGWLFTALKPNLYDGISCGFQFPLFFLAAIIGGYCAAKADPGRKKLWYGCVAAMLGTYIFWGLTARQSRFIYPVFFAAGVLAFASFSVAFAPLWKRLLTAAAAAAALISVMSIPGYLMHYYISFKVLGKARTYPSGFAVAKEPEYCQMLQYINQLPKTAKIASLNERRTLYMPRDVEIIMPFFQERLTPVPDTPEKLFQELKEFDYLIARIPLMDVDRAPEYDGETGKLYNLIFELCRQGKLSVVPETQNTILRVETSAAGRASDNSSSN